MAGMNPAAEQSDKDPATQPLDKKKKVKRILYIIGSVLLYIFMALCLVAVIITVFSKKSDDGAVNLFGYQMRIVITGSMEKNDLTDVSGFKIKDIPQNSLVVSQNAPDSDEEGYDEWIEQLEVGDVLVFRYFLGGEQLTITHRIIDKQPATEGYQITLRGDNRTENEGVQVIYTDEDVNPEPVNYILGKVVFKSLVLGSVISILQKPVGIACAVIVPAAIIIVLQIIRIINVFNAEKRKKVEQREAEKSDEIELLKQRLAEMEKKQNLAETASGNAPPENAAGPLPPSNEDTPASAREEPTAADTAQPEPQSEEPTATDTAEPEPQSEEPTAADAAQPNPDSTGPDPEIQSLTEPSKEVEP